MEYIQEQGDGLVLMVRTAQDRSAAVRAEFLTDSAVRLKMFTFPEEKERFRNGRGVETEGKDLFILFLFRRNASAAQDFGS